MLPLLFTIQQERKSFYRQGVTVLLCSLCLTLLVPAYCSAQASRKVEKQRIEQGIEKYRINISKLQEGIDIQQVHIESVKKKQRNLLEELAEIDNRLIAQLNKVHDLEEKMQRQEKLITTKEQELIESQVAKQLVQLHLQKRIKAFYKMGEIGTANVAFSTESMPRMLKFRDSFANLLDYDKKLINIYRSSISEIQQAKTTLNLEKVLLDDFITAAKTEQLASTTIKLEKKVLLTQIKTQKKLHEQAVKEMEMAAASLTKSLDKLERKSELFNQGFLLDKGKHPSPVQGKVVAVFGQERENRLGIKGETTGITIATEGVKSVFAIFEGEIRYAAYLYGYGNTIIIDHGYKYFSIISRLEHLLVAEGDKVEQGDVIALTGDTATLMEEGIYFEIRHGSQPTDPLAWLEKNSLLL